MRPLLLYTFNSISLSEVRLGLAKLDRSSSFMSQNRIKYLCFKDSTSAGNQCFYHYSEDGAICPWRSELIVCILPPRFIYDIETNRFSS